MPINYGLVDPTEGMNRGLGTLAQALQYRQQMERQAQQDAMTAKSHGLQNTLSQMGIDKSTAEQNALMGATGQPDLQSALGTQLKTKMEAEAQKLQAEKITRYSTVLEHLNKAPFDDATKTEYLKAAIGKDPDFAEFVKNMSLKSQPAASDYSLKEIYGPNGATKSVPVSKTGGYTPERGWSLAPPLKPDTLSPEAEAQKKRIRAAGKSDLSGKLDRSDRIFGSNLRKEFNALPEIKEANQITPKIKSMEAAYQESQKTKNFVAVDQALITLYNKLTDPSSVVRESEYARTAMNIPLINQIKGKMQKVMEGGAGLTQEERASLLTMARLMKTAYNDIKDQRYKEYRSYADDAGLDGAKVLRNPYAPPTGADTLPQGFKAGW